jgi:hypothetical protein
MLKKGGPIQCLKTPKDVPDKDSVLSSTTKLLKPDKETVEIDFTPERKDISLEVWGLKRLQDHASMVMAFQKKTDGKVQMEYRMVGSENIPFPVGCYDGVEVINAK